MGLAVLGAAAIVAGMVCIAASGGTCAAPLVVFTNTAVTAGRGAGVLSSVTITVGAAAGTAVGIGGVAGITTGTGVLFNKSNGGSDVPGSLSRGDMKKLGDKQYEKAMGESAHDFKWDVVGGQVSRWDIYHGKDGMLYLISKDGRVIVPTYKPWKG